VEGSGRHLLEAVKFNLKTAPEKRSLMVVEKGNQESMRTYVQR